MRPLALALLLVGCVEAQTPRGTTPPGAPAPATAADNEDNDPVCHEESVTGSNMTRTVCRTKSQSEHDRDDAKSFRERTSRQRQTLQGK
jgi:hypothetical protein